MPRTLAPKRYYLFVVLFLTLLLGSVDDAGVNPVLGYLQWLLQVAVPMGLLLLGQRLLMGTGFRGGNPWLVLSLGGILGGVLFSPLALVLDVLFQQSPAPETSAAWLNAWTGELFGSIPPIALSWVALNAPLVLGWNITFERKTEPVTPLNTPVTPVAPPDLEPESVQEAPVREGDGGEDFWLRIPDALGQDVICLSSELHYLRVTTTKGDTLLLYTLRDAMAQMPPDWGMQTHRSWAAARHHVQSLGRRGKQQVLHLTNDLLAPVSRRKLSEVKSWLSPDADTTTAHEAEA